MAGAIFQVKVPDTISKSACRGDARIASIPKRDISNRDIAEASISKTQQARPKATGQTADLLPQLSKASIEVTARFPWRSSGTLIRGSGKASWQPHLISSIVAPSIRSRSHTVPSACSVEAPVLIAVVVDSLAERTLIPC